MGKFFSDIESWITYPWKNNIPPGVLISWGVILLLIILWLTDGLRLLKKMGEAASSTLEAVP